MIPFWEAIAGGVATSACVQVVCWDWSGPRRWAAGMLVTLHLLALLQIAAAVTR